jgi:hypothetical protein
MSSTIQEFLSAHLPTMFTLYLMLGMVGMIGYMAVPLRKKFPRFAGIIEFCRCFGPDAKKLLDAIGLLFLGRVPSNYAEVVWLLLKRVLGLSLLVYLFAGCSGAKLPTSTSCPVVDRTVQHVQLVLSLASVACQDSPCAVEVEKAKAFMATAEKTRKQACEAWPYLVKASSLAANDKFDAAVKLGDVLLSCD